MEVASPTLGKKPKREKEEVPRSPLLPRTGGDALWNGSPKNLVGKNTGLRKVSLGATGLKGRVSDKDLAAMRVEERAVVLAGVAKDDVSRFIFSLFRRSRITEGILTKSVLFGCASDYFFSTNGQEDASRGRRPSFSLLQRSGSEGSSCSNGRNSRRIPSSFTSFSTHLGRSTISVSLCATKTDHFSSVSFSSSVEPTIDQDASRKLAKLSNSHQATITLPPRLRPLEKQESTSPSSTTGAESLKVSSTSWIEISRGPLGTRRR